MDLNLPQGMNAEEEKDVLGGNGPLESGVYKGIVELAYIDASPRGAKRITIHFKPNKVVNKVIKFTTYISNAQGQFTYTRDGVTKVMPGYNQMNSFFKTLTGKDLSEQTSSERTLKIWNPDKQKEMPTPVMVFDDSINKPLAIGILKVNEEKTTKESNYEQGTGEFIEKNEFSKYFDPDNGLTLAEKADGTNTPDFLNKWKKKWDGQTITRKAKVPAPTTGATQGAPTTSNGGSQTTSLF